jgi:hypothetical protein
LALRELILEINKTVIVASSWSSIFTLPTLMMHGQTQIKYTYIHTFIYIYIYLLACSITLIISNTTCYLQLVFTVIFPLLLFGCSLVVVLCSDVLFLLCVDFVDLVHLFREFCKCLVVLFDKLILVYGPIVCFCYCCY